MVAGIDNDLGIRPSLLGSSNSSPENPFTTASSITTPCQLYIIMLYVPTEDRRIYTPERVEESHNA